MAWAQACEPVTGKRDRHEKVSRAQQHGVQKPTRRWLAVGSQQIHSPVQRGRPLDCWDDNTQRRRQQQRKAPMRPRQPQQSQRRCKKRQLLHRHVSNDPSSESERICVRCSIDITANEAQEPDLHTFGRCHRRLHASSSSCKQDHLPSASTRSRLVRRLKTVRPGPKSGPITWNYRQFRLSDRTRTRASASQMVDMPKQRNTWATSSKFQGSLR